MSKDTIQALANEKYPLMEIRIGMDSMLVQQKELTNISIKREQAAFIEGSKLAIDTNPLVKALEKMTEFEHKDKSCSLEAQGYDQAQCELIGFKDYVAQLAREALNGVQFVQLVKKDGGEQDAIAFGKHLARNGWKPYDDNNWENSEDDTASTETIYNDFKITLNNVQVVQPAKTDGEEPLEEALKNTMFMTGGNKDAEKDIYAMGARFGYGLAPQPDSVKGTLVRDVYRSVLTLVANYCTQLSDDYNNDDYTQKADAIEVLKKKVVALIDCEDSFNFVTGNSASPVTNPHTDKQELDELREWKRQAIEVMPDMQAIGKELNIKLGESVHDKILPGIIKLKQQSDKQEGMRWVCAKQQTPPEGKDCNLKVDRMPFSGRFWEADSDSVTSIGFSHFNVAGKTILDSSHFHRIFWLDESAGADNAEQIKKEKIALIWEMIMNWQDADDDQFTKQDIEVDLYAWLEKVDPKEKKENQKKDNEREPKGWTALFTDEKEYGEYLKWRRNQGRVSE